jgi:rhamnosyltransferase subunit B
MDAADLQNHIMSSATISRAPQSGRSVSVPKARSRHIILACWGTDGDVYPFLGLGTVLRNRGYRVTLATREHFAGRATQAGLEFRSMVSSEETEKLFAQPDFWHPVKGPLLMMRWGLPLVRQQHTIFTELASQEGALLIAHPGVLAARILQEHSGVPLVSVILQPWMLTSVHAPPAMMGGLTLPRWTPQPVGRIYYRVIDGVGDLLIGRELNRLRASFGLRPMRRIFRWWFSPQLVLGMFPSWYGQPQADWPPQIKLVGFPMDDGRGNASVPEKTIEFIRAGTPPIAFTFGTGMLHAAEVFRECIAACRILRRRGILVTNFREQLRAKLPAFIHHCDFAPFQDLFPLCAAVIHHGGVGTVAKALAVGVPQLILPFSFDQLDNAMRVKKLGAGDFLEAKRRNPKTIAAGLSKLLAANSAAAAQKLVKHFDTRSGLECAADEVEAFAIAL